MGKCKKCKRCRKLVRMLIADYRDTAKASRDTPCMTTRENYQIHAKALLDRLIALVR